MCTRPTENLILVKQQYPDTTEQLSIHSYSGNRKPCSISPIFLRHRPRRKPMGQIFHLYQSPNVMSFPHVINTVLGCTLPDGIPSHRAPPQLCQIHVVANNMSAQILLNVLAIECTRSGLCGTKMLLPLLAHLIKLKPISAHKRK